MKLMMKLNLALTILLGAGSVYAQGEAAAPFLTLQQSPLFIGAGNTGASMANNDAAGFYFNPANLGNFSKTSNLGIYFMPENSNWFFPGNTTRTLGLSLGYNFADTKINLPISIGFGYIHNRFNYGRFFSGNNSIESYDKFDNFSFGVGVDYYLQFNFGISYKTFYSQLGIPPGISSIRGTASGSAFDFGAMITLPISELLIKDYQYSLNANSSLIPFLNLTLGYSLTNYGDKIDYGDPAQSDPIPRTARLGYTLDFGVNMKLGENIINIAKLSIITELDDILIERNAGIGGTNYQGLLGDISFTDNFLAQKGNSKVAIHRGSAFDFLETATLLYGRIDGRGYRNIRTRGLILHTDGLAKLLFSSVENPELKFITDHFSLQYYNVEYFRSERIEGISLNVKNVSFNNLGF